MRRGIGLALAAGAVAVATYVAALTVAERRFRRRLRRPVRDWPLVPADPEGGWPGLLGPDC